MKRIFCALLCGALLTTLSACGGSKQVPAETEAPVEEPAEVVKTITFHDDLDREVTLAKPSRVAALIGSFADVWCLAGGQDTLVAAADDSWTQFELDLPETVEILAGRETSRVTVADGVAADFTQVQEDDSWVWLMQSEKASEEQEENDTE